VDAANWDSIVFHVAVFAAVVVIVWAIQSLFGGRGEGR
jgi:hypothetical protein